MLNVLGHLREALRLFFTKCYAIDYIKQA